jgi:two-component system, OmpR family, alkaline phosphatase synthesis response regulator PhoP
METHLHREGPVRELIIDRETYLVHYKGVAFSLPKKEFELLSLLASRPGKVFTRTEIFFQVWKKNLAVGNGRTIDVHIRKLREKLDGVKIAGKTWIHHS